MAKLGNPIPSPAYAKIDEMPGRKNNRSLGIFKRIFAHIYEVARQSHREFYDQPIEQLNNNQVGLDEVHGTTFTIIPCDGGFVITTKSYDTVGFDIKYNRYVITHSENIGERLETIFGFEAIKK